jgi:hypothetical protein
MFGSTNAYCDESQFSKHNLTTCADLPFNFTYAVTNVHAIPSKYVTALIGQQGTNLLGTPISLTVGQSANVTDAITIDACNSLHSARL